MRPLHVVVLAALAALPALVTPQAPPPTADLYRDEPFVLEHSDSTFRMAADGTGERIQHVVVRIQSEGMARQFSVVNFAYASANEKAAIEYVRVHKADGSTVETPVADTMDMASEVTRQAPVYSDIKEKHLAVRSLSSGDRLEYQLHTLIDKPLDPGQFWGAEHFVASGFVVLSQTITLDVPAETYVQVWSPNHPVKPTTHDGRKVWLWTWSQTKPSSRNADGTMKPADLKDSDEDADGRTLPSVAWTTFRNWAQVGAWYGGLIEPRIQPTPAIRAKAEELTRNFTTPQAQADALYRFVAAQIHYISIGFGTGRIQPHPAEEVLANGYGDCKDKDTLLESLLRAKGFTTAPALIGAGIALVPEVPTPSPFNHAITTLQIPGTGQVWLDSTAEVAPFRVLSPVIRDQQALVISSSAATLQTTPADPPYPYKERFDSIMTLSKDGILKGKITLALRSDNELAYRQLIQQTSPSQWDQMMQYMSNAMNFGGKVSNADFRQADPASPVHITYDYTREDFADWKNNRIVANFPMLDVVTLDKDKAPDHDIDLGAPRTVEAHSEITLPDGDRAELPNAVHVNRPYMSFDKTYRLQDGRMIADRVLVVKQHKLSKDQWKDYLAFAKGADWETGESYAILIPDGVRSPNSSDAIASTTAASSSDATTWPELSRKIRALEQQHDWVGARALSDTAKQKFTKEPYVLSTAAYIDAHDHKDEDAIAGYKAELAAHPDDSSEIVSLLGGAYWRQKRYADEIALLRSYSKRNDNTLTFQLIGTLTGAGDREGALNTARDALRSKPEDKSLQTEEARLLQALHRNDEAVKAVNALSTATPIPI